ncbi:flagellar basal body L-ring protein FlgH [Vibrio sp. PNB22_3_1]
MKVIYLLFAVLLTGCASTGSDLIEKVADIEEAELQYAPPKINYEVVKETSGSLYAGRSSITLYKDRRAYRVGDILTVVLDEKTESQKSSSSAFGKTTGVNVGVPTLGGLGLDDFNASLNSDRSFDGSAAANQGNRLSGSITVTIHEVFPNGVLRVVGEKWMKLNQGDEYIRLSGNIRAEDIGSDNRVSSERLADARISYAGQGVLSDSNEPGWLTRLLNSKWMPF